MLKAKRVITFTAVLLLSSSGCVMRMGPKTIRGDRFDYSAAISSSWKTQMMLNLVRMRYLDPPIFLDVAQVVATYTQEATANANTPDWNSGLYYPSASVSGRWAESPTITYNPMTGEKFTKSLLAPISPVSIFQLVQAGWPLDSVFAIAVKGINGIRGVGYVQVLQQEGDPQFYQVLRLLRELQLTNMFSVRVKVPKEGESGEPVIEFRRRAPDEVSLAKAKEVKQLLGLKQDESEFKLAFGATQTNDQEVAILTRSILEIVAEAATGVEIPESDLKEGRAVPPAGISGEGEQRLQFRVKVRSSKSKPGPNDAFAAGQYHGHWFWVDDRDLVSKRGLGFLMVLATLAESGTSMAPPILTISKP